MIIQPDAGGTYEVCFNDNFRLDGSQSIIEGVVDGDVTVDWLLDLGETERLLATGLGPDGLIADVSTGPDSIINAPGWYEIVLRITYESIEYIDRVLLKVCADCGVSVSEPGTFGLAGTGAAVLALLYRQRRRRRARQVAARG